ncbi:hypothetical protein AOLI_G00140740 [Acnodon oligacanthus]
MARDMSDKDILKMELDQLKKEVGTSRTAVSATAPELIAYTEAQSAEDPLIRGVPEDKNPFKEKGGGVYWYLTGISQASRTAGARPEEKRQSSEARMDEFYNLEKDEAPEKVPLMFISFPSAKDPTSKIRYPGKTCTTILTVVSYEWSEEWNDTMVKKNDYMGYKTRFAKHLLDWACMYFPKLREKLVFQEVATPLTNVHCLGAYRGAMYSAEHNLEHFHVEVMAKNRCDTPVKNLFGQNVFSRGIVGAVHGGLLCASTALGRIVYVNLLLLKKKLKRRKAGEMAALSKEKLQ